MIQPNTNPSNHWLLPSSPQELEQFVKTATDKLLTYAIGRGLEHYDAPAIRGVVRAAAADNYRWSSTILALVKSAPFRMRRTGS